MAAKRAIVVLTTLATTPDKIGAYVGYDIIEHVPPSQIGKISATKIRAGEIGQDGKPLGKRPESWAL